MSYLQLSDRQLASFNKNWGWLFGWGVALVLLGLIAISVSTFTTIVSVIFLGALIFISGIVMIVDSFKFWWGQWRGFFSHLVLGALYVAVGLVLMQNPVEGSMSLTLLLGIFYLIVGAFRIGSSLAVRLGHWGWNFFNGVVSFILGLLILGNWPEASLFIIGLFIGIDLLVCGWVYIMLAIAARPSK